MKFRQPFFIAALLWGCACFLNPDVAGAQHATVPDTGSVVVPASAGKGVKAKPAPDSRFGKFNYTYLRLAYFFTASGFGNPVAAGFTGSETFTAKSDLPGSFRLGVESGKVRHFKKLNLGTDMLKLGINSGIALQAFGNGNRDEANASAYSDGTYLIRFGLGPQLSFKPIEDLRIGVFYRAGIAVVYSSYVNEQRTTIDAERMQVDRADVHFLHYAYNGDIGIDCAWRSLCFAVTYSMMKARPSKGSLIDPKTLGEAYNTYSSGMERAGVTEGTPTVTEIDPTVKWNRIGVSVGFAF